MKSCQISARRTSTAGFTLVELLVVVSIIALLVAILLPSLKKAREQTKQLVCLANMRGFGTGIATYGGDAAGKLPGPLHPAVYRYQTIRSYADWGTTDPNAAKKLRDRQITWVISSALGQRGGEGLKKNVTDAVSTCPVLAGIVPDQHFKDFKATNSKSVMPMHYAINNYGAATAEQVGVLGNVRQTDPPYYFGFSPPPGTESQPAMIAEANANPPRAIEKIKRASDEWMVADAWYRGISVPGLPQQEGPYQSSWSGEALPYFAPHFRVGNKEVPVDITARNNLGKLITAKNRSDGRTPTVYFDGHAAPVMSKQLKVLKADGSLFGKVNVYGFPGTVNPRETFGKLYEWE